MIFTAGDDAYKSEEDDQLVALIQTEFNDLTKDLNFSKESTELLCTRLKNKHLLAPRTTFYWYRDRQRENLDTFSRFRISQYWFIAATLNGLFNVGSKL